MTINGIVEYGAPIGLAHARKVAAACEAAVVARGWAVVIAIVDSGAHPVLLHRMDHVQLGSITVALQKAETAARFKRPSKAFEEALGGGGINLRVLGMTNLVPLEGGLPIFIDGRIVGAIGISGLTSAQDVEIAEIGAAVLP